VPELGRVGHHVQLGDPALGHGEAQNPDRLLEGAEQQARRAVDDGRPGVGDEPHVEHVVQDERQAFGPSRSQACCTASWASVTEPSMP
jgi:hypothetical protein